jgi:hypothetical protein
LVAGGLVTGGGLGVGVAGRVTVGLIAGGVIGTVAAAVVGVPTGEEAAPEPGVT